MKEKKSYQPMFPGELIKSALVERGLSQKEFAEAVGVRASHISEILKGKRRVTIPFANTIEDLLGIPSRILLDMQMACDIVSKIGATKSNEEEIAQVTLAEYDMVINISELLKGSSVAKSSSVDRLSYLQSYYQLESPDQLRAQYSKLAESCFRRSAKTGLDERMIATWVVKARAEACANKPINKFNPSDERLICSSISEILHANHNTKQAIKETLNKFGIGFCEVSKLNHASIDGYSFIQYGTPYIVITGRYDRIDNLAFTVMHELGHIFLGHTTENCHQINVDTRSFNDEAMNPKEEAADAFASEYLIPHNVWKLAPTVGALIPFVIQNKYSVWATKRHLNKWIVLGRLSHETGIYKFKSDSSRCVHAQKGGVL